jgi:hypothetical protein
VVRSKRLLRRIQVDVAVAVNKAIFPIKPEIFSKPGTEEPVPKQASEDARDYGKADDENHRRVRGYSRSPSDYDCGQQDSNDN